MPSINSMFQQASKIRIYRQILSVEKNFNFFFSPSYHFFCREYETMRTDTNDDKCNFQCYNGLKVLIGKENESKEKQIEKCF